MNLLSCGRCSMYECVVLLLAFLLLCCCFLDFFLSLSLSNNFLYSPHWPHPVTQSDLSDPEWTVEMAVSNPHVDPLCRPAERESRGSSPRSQHLARGSTWSTREALLTRSRWGETDQSETSILVMWPFLTNQGPRKTLWWGQKLNLIFCFNCQLLVL